MSLDVDSFIAAHRPELELAIADAAEEMLNCADCSSDGLGFVACAVHRTLDVSVVHAVLALSDYDAKHAEAR